MMALELEIPVPGGVLHVWRQGSGPPVLVLHGGPGLSEYTEPLVAELEDAFTVYRYQQTRTSSVDHIRTVRRRDPYSRRPGCSGGYRSRARPMSSDTHGVVIWVCTSQPTTPIGYWDWWPLIRSEQSRTAARPIWDGSGRERISPEDAARAGEPDERALAGEGTPEEFLEGLALLWPAYFSSAAVAPPMPPMAMSIHCYADTFESIHEQFRQGTLQEMLPHIQVPSVFLLGAASPIPPEHGIASAALIPGARYEVLDECGHFVWLEFPGSVPRVWTVLLSDVRP